MSRRFITSVFIGFTVLFSGCGTSEKDSSGSFLATPYEAIVSEQGEGWMTINSELSRMVFSRHDANWENHTLFEMTKSSEGWSEPVVMPFSGTYNDRGARFYPALDAMLFSSDRPVDADDTTRDFNLWIAMHDGESWLEPEALYALNTDANDFHGSVAEDGSIYFVSDRSGGKGLSDIYQAVLGRDGYSAHLLPGAVNTEFSESDVFISPDSRFILFSRTNDPNGLGEDDLWISFPSEAGWSAAINLGPEVNTAKGEYGAMLSPNQMELIYSTHKDGSGDIVTIPMSSIAIEWPSN